MLQKLVRFNDVSFPQKVIEEAFAIMHTQMAPMYQAFLYATAAKEATKKGTDSEYSRAGEPEVPSDLLHYTGMSITAGLTRWSFDSAPEFFSELRKPHSEATVSIQIRQKYAYVGYESFDSATYSLVQVDDKDGATHVRIKLPNRSAIEQVFTPFADAAPTLTRPKSVPPKPKPVIFIGHGGSSTQWRELKDHLSDIHGYDVQAFESGARAGHAIRDILGDLVAESTFAVLIMTSEDEQADGSMRARQNVIHEAGLFQGALGFSRAVILLEDGTQHLSNLDGVQYIPFSRNNIKETFGDVLGVLRREFGS